MPTSTCRFEQRHSDFIRLAITEVNAGRPVSTWTTHLLPRIGGLPNRRPDDRHDVCSVQDAEEYLRTRPLFLGYWAIAEALRSQVVLARVPVIDLFPPPDDLTLIASLTLVGATCRRLGEPAHLRLADICAEMLRVAATQGYEPCPTTLAVMGVTAWQGC